MWVWPDLVYTELISLILCSVVLIVWSILLKAPLEQPANPANTPNPSKAPWYFLGLQEMLVYFDPWLAGVVLPGLIIVGPDRDSRTSTRIRRATATTRSTSGRPEITIFLFGFAVLWVVAHRARHVPARTELELLRAVRILGHPQARGADQRQPVRVHLGAAAADRVAAVLAACARSAGILLVLFYVFALPVILAKSLFKTLLRRSWVRRATTSSAFLFLMMMSLPIKMLLAVDLQPEVHRGNSRNSSSTSESMAEKKGVGHAYNVDFLNVVFAASSIFLFLSIGLDGVGRLRPRLEEHAAAVRAAAVRRDAGAVSAGVARRGQGQAARSCSSSSPRPQKNVAANQAKVDELQKKLDEVEHPARPAHARLSVRRRRPTTTTATTSRRRARRGCRARRRRARTSPRRRSSLSDARTCRSRS